MLKVGINWLSPYTLPTVRRLLDEGIADFCEIMVDNAVHLSADKIRAALPGVPLALHIVNSNFLTKSSDELESMSQHLRPWIAELQPIYVSDHLPQLNYQTDFAKTRDRVSEWQKLLDTRLLLENLPSMSNTGAGQAEFYARLLQAAQCELLFDFSNAYIAEYNGAQEFKAWQPLITQANHFHVAGFRIDPSTRLATDTHDVPIADEVLALMRPHLSNTRERTIVLELDTQLDYEMTKLEVARISAFSARNPGSEPRTALSEAVDDATKGVAAPRAVKGALKASSKLNIKEKLIKKVQEWSLRGLDHIPAKGIIMRSKAAPDMAVGLWKSAEPDQPAKIVTLDITAAKLPPADAYAISYQAGSWAGVEWVGLS